MSQILKPFQAMACLRKVKFYKIIILDYISLVEYSFYWTGLSWGQFLREYDVLLREIVLKYRTEDVELLALGLLLELQEFLTDRNKSELCCMLHNTRTQRTVSQQIFMGAIILDTRSLTCLPFLFCCQVGKPGEGIEIEITCKHRCNSCHFSLPPAYLLASKTKEFLHFLFCVSTRYFKCCISPAFLPFYIL